MALITKEEVVELANAQHDLCVSIFIPTNRSKTETLRWKGFLPLKSQLDDLKQTLEKKDWSPEEIELFVQPIENLIHDTNFWRHLSDGLAIYLAKGFFKKYVVPIHFDEFTYLSTGFYLKPILPLVIEDNRFLLLSLTKDEVKLYELTQYTITEVIIDDLIPSQLEDAVGYDYEQNSVQFRTQKGNMGVGSFHGQLDNEVEKKEELTRYFREVNKGLVSLYHSDKAPPLVLACVDYYYPLYKEVNTYKNIYPQHLSGDPMATDVFLLHERARDLLNPYFRITRREKLKLFLQNIGTGKASYDPREIIPASVTGKVDTLFLEKGEDVYGVYNDKTAEAEVQGRSDKNISLANKAAIDVFLNDGKVYLMEKEDMPMGISSMMALYRF